LKNVQREENKNSMTGSYKKEILCGKIIFFKQLIYSGLTPTFTSGKIKGNLSKPQKTTNRYFFYYKWFNKKYKNRDAGPDG
jgi:hypothetical protein